MVAFVRALAQVAEQMARDGRQDGNAVLMIVGCVLGCILNCLGDIMEYLNDWAYVQLALRGTDYCTSAKITFSMCTVANCKRKHQTTIKRCKHFELGGEKKKKGQMLQF